MADSDHSGPSNLTRRRLLGGAAALHALPLHPLGVRDFDPVLSLWRAFQNRHVEAIARCRDWQQAERLLLQAPGYPRARLLSGGTLPPADPDRQADLPPAIAAAEARLAAAGIRQDEAWAARDELAWTMLTMPAASLAGIAAKLALTAQMGESRPEDPDFPWPQIRSVLTDVTRLGRLDPGQFAVHHE